MFEDETCEAEVKVANAAYRIIRREEMNSVQRATMLAALGVSQAGKPGIVQSKRVLDPEGWKKDRKKRKQSKKSRRRNRR